MASIGNINKTYVSAQDPVLDTREINRQVTDVANEMQLTKILDVANLKAESKQAIYYTFVNEPLFKVGDTTGATVLNNGTNVVTTTFTVASSGYARKGDLGLFPNKVVGQVQSITTTAGADTVVFKAVGGGNITTVAGDKISLNSFAAGEASVSQNPLRFGFTRYSNKLQIFREPTIITDVQAAATLEVTVAGSDRYVMKAHLDAKLRLEGFINSSFISGDLSAASFTDVNPVLTDQNAGVGGLGGGGAVQTTRGLDKYISAYGVQTNTTTPGVLIAADLKNHLDSLTANRCPTSYMVAGSKSVIGVYDDFFKNVGSSGVTSVRMMANGKELDFNVEKVMYHGYELNFVNMPILDNPALMNYTNITKSSYYIPLDKKVKVDNGGSEPCIRTRYQKAGYKYGNDMVGEIHYGAQNPVAPSGTAAVFGMDYISTQGLEVLGAQFFARFQMN